MKKKSTLLFKERNDDFMTIIFNKTKKEERKKTSESLHSQNTIFENLLHPFLNTFFPNKLIKC